MEEDKKSWAGWIGAAVVAAMLAAGALWFLWEPEKTGDKIAQAKDMAEKVMQVANAVCDVTPQAAALANAVMGMSPTTVGVATVATTICVWVKTPKSSVATFADTCPGGIVINGVCVPVEKE
jgi:hypothetical protein